MVSSRLRDWYSGAGVKLGEPPPLGRHTPGQLSEEDKATVVLQSNQKGRHDHSLEANQCTKTKGPVVMS